MRAGYRAAMDVRPVPERIAACEPRRPFVLVGIGGRGGSGKTTLATAIPGAQVVATDEFWNGEEFELTRLAREVLEPLLRGDEARYRAFDWTARRPARASASYAPRASWWSRACARCTGCFVTPTTCASGWRRRGR